MVQVRWQLLQRNSRRLDCYQQCIHSLLSQVQSNRTALEVKGRYEHCCLLEEYYGNQRRVPIISIEWNTRNQQHTERPQTSIPTSKKNSWGYGNGTYWNCSRPVSHHERAACGRSFGHSEPGKVPLLLSHGSLSRTIWYGNAHVDRLPRIFCLLEINASWCTLFIHHQ